MGEGIFSKKKKMGAQSILRGRKSSKKKKM